MASGSPAVMMTRSCAAAPVASSHAVTASSPTRLERGTLDRPSALRRAQMSPDAPSCLACSTSSSISRREYDAAPSTTSARTAPDVSSAARKGPNVLARTRSREVVDRHPAPEIGLVGSVLRHRLAVRHARERTRDVNADLREGGGDGRLDQLEHEFLRRERDLDVHLRELGLAVGAQVLVAEAARDLEVAIHARDHQDLLEHLRRLRQREELAGCTRLGTR